MSCKLGESVSSHKRGRLMTDDAGRSTRGEAASESDPRSTEGTPRWVKVFGIVAIVVVVLFVVLLIVGVPHNPGRHMGARAGQITRDGA
jgi:hypothetical protein